MPTSAILPLIRNERSERFRKAEHRIASITNLGRLLVFDLSFPGGLTLTGDMSVFLSERGLLIICWNLLSDEGVVLGLCQVWVMMFFARLTLSTLKAQMRVIKYKRTPTAYSPRAVLAVSFD